jgi:hypothetical protein
MNVNKLSVPGSYLLRAVFFNLKRFKVVGRVKVANLLIIQKSFFDSTGI